MSSATSDPDRPVDEYGSRGVPSPPPTPGAEPAAPPTAGPAGPGELSVAGGPELSERPASGEWAPPAAGRGSPRRAVGRGIATVLGLALLGVPLGLLWFALAPTVPVVKTANGAVLADPQPEQFIAADGWFSLLGLGFGVLAAIVVWLVLRRDRGPVGLLLVVLGCAGAAVLAWRLGRQIGLSDYQELLASAPVDQAFGKPADLRAGGFTWLAGVIPVPRGDLLLPAFAAAVTYTLLAGWSRWPSLRPEAEPELAAAPLLHPPGVDPHASYPPGAGQTGPYPVPPVPAGPYPEQPGPQPAQPSGPAGSEPAGSEPAGFSSESVDQPAPSAAPEPPGPGAAGPSRD